VPKERLPVVAEWNDSELLANEKESLGFYITGHPLNKYREKLDELGVVPTIELKDLQEKQEVNLGGLVIDIKKIQTKKTGDLMAYVTIEDMYSTAEVIVFPEVFSESQEYLMPDSAVVISGSVQQTEKGTKIIARQIAPIENSSRIKSHTARRKGPATRNDKAVRTEPASKSLTLTLFHDANSARMNELATIFAKHSGDHRVYLRIIAPKKWETVMTTDLHVMPSENMVTEVEELFGRDKVAMKGIPAQEASGPPSGIHDQGHRVN